MKSFETSSYLSQLKQLRKIADVALKRYQLKVKQVKFIYHGENTTYKVVANEGIFLLRIHRKNYHSKAAILEELNWLKRLAKQTNNIQKPLVSKNGLLVEEVTNDTLKLTRCCSLLSWQQGIIKDKSISPDDMRAVGLLTAQLHKSTVGKKVKHRNYWTLDGLLSEKSRFGSYKNLQAELTDNQYKIIDKCRKMAFKKIRQYQLKEPYKLALIHSDLHFSNIVWSKNIPIPIDFDDSGYGFYMYDIAVTLSSIDYHLFKKDKRKDKQLFVESLFKGYTSIKNLSTADINILPYFKLASNLTNFSWLYDRKSNPFLFEKFKKGKQKRINYYKKVLCNGPQPLY